MKLKKWLLTLVAFAVMAVVCAVCAGAEEYSSGLWKYTKQSNGTAYISAYSGFDSNLNIPSTLNGLTVSGIDDDAFYNNKNITNVVIPSSVTYIGSRAFAGSSITSINIPSTVTDFGYDYWDDTYSTFNNCDKLTTVLFNAKASVPEKAFYDCDALTTVTIGDYTTDIGESAFEGCDNLSAVKLGNSIKHIYTVTYSNNVNVGTAKITIKGIGNYTGTVTKTFKITKLPKVSGAKLGGRAADALRVNWTRNASADGYIVEMYKNGKWVRAAKITNKNTTTFRKAGLKASTVYKFRVRAYKMIGSVAAYSDYTATITARTNPSIMKGVKIGGKAKDALRVNWAKNASAQGYIVEMYKGGKWVRVAKITNNNTTTFRKAGLAKNTAYKFRVRAYHMSGKTALYGNYGSVSGRTAAK